MPPTDRFVARASFHVRYAETDAMGIVHHASYIVYFEEGRSHYIRQRGSSYAAMEESGYYLAVTDVQARYIKAAHYDQRISIYCWIETFRSRAITFAYEIRADDTGDLFVTGISKHICLDRQGNVVKIPAKWQLVD